MSLSLVGTPVPTTPMSLERLIPGIRKDFRDATRLCDKKGRFRTVITPARVAIRFDEGPATTVESAVRADFIDRRCAHSLQMSNFYRTVAEELPFKGIQVWFGERTIQAKIGEAEEEVFMLMPTFKVPSKMIQLPVGR